MYDSKPPLPSRHNKNDFSQSKPLSISTGVHEESTPICTTLHHTELRKKSNEQGLIIFSSPPYGKITAQEGQELAMAASAFYPSLSVLFLGDGVLNCLNTQTPTDTLKSFFKIFETFPLYDIHHLYATQQDCEQRGLKAENFNLPLQLLDQIGLQSLLHNAHWILQY